MRGQATGRLQSLHAYRIGHQKDTYSIGLFSVLSLNAIQIASNEDGEHACEYASGEIVDWVSDFLERYLGHDSAVEIQLEHATLIVLIVDRQQSQPLQANSCMSND